MELWDIYDIDRNKTDKIMERGAKFNEGDYHLAVHICIFNSKGEMIREGTFIPYYESLLDLFFDSYKNYGFIRR